MGSRQVWVGEAPVDGFSSPFAGAEFAVMVAAFRTAAAVDRVRLARSIVEQGCRYAVCAGTDCDHWEDAFDTVAVERNPDGDASRLVMTTSHRDESLDEVAEFLFTCTFIDDRVPERLVVLTVGGQSGDHEEVKEAVARVLARYTPR